MNTLNIFNSQKSISANEFKTAKGETAIVIYHSADPDGIFSGYYLYLALSKLYPSVSTLGYDYGQSIDIDYISSFESVYIVDVNLSIENSIYLSKKVNLFYIDHHITFFENVMQNLQSFAENAFFAFPVSSDWNHSALEIVYNIFFLEGRYPVFDTEPFPYLLGRADVWDSKNQLWESHIRPAQKNAFGAFDVKSAGALLDIYLIQYQDCFYLDIEKFVDAGRIQLEKENFEAAMASKNCEFIQFEDGYFIASNENKPALMKALENTEEKIYFLLLYKRKNGVYNYTLFAGNQDFDCGAFARARGGGGHKGAAGFQSDKLIL